MSDEQRAEPPLVDVMTEEMLQDIVESRSDDRTRQHLRAMYSRGWNDAITAAIALLHEDQQERFMKLAERMARLSESEGK
jgi:lipopolysaccharide biosynthesis regulator YciM